MEGLNRKPKMSCRIDRVVSAESLVVLFVSGRITGEHVEMLRGVLEQESGGFAIDLKNVLFVDREAVKLLALSEANGTELRNCPPYIREWVMRERAETHGRRSEQVREDTEDGSKVTIERTPAISGLAGSTRKFLAVVRRVLL
jgi:hypothetical protein